MSKSEKVTIRTPGAPGGIIKAVVDREELAEIARGFASRAKSDDRRPGEPYGSQGVSYDRLAAIIAATPDGLQTREDILKNYIVLPYGARRKS